MNTYLKLNNILFLLFFSSINVSYSQYFDTIQMNNIEQNRSAVEGDMYLDTNLNEHRIGLTHGKLGKLTDNQKLRSDTINNVIYLEDGDSVDLKMLLSPRFYVGKFRITSSGTIAITGLPFKPNMISFVSFGNVQDYDLDSDNGVANNTNTIVNTFNYMKGYARDDNGLIDEQCICGGGNGTSINDISRYASSSHCIGVRYANQNGDRIGLTSATLISFDISGFTIDVDNFSDGLVVLFEAYR